MATKFRRYGLSFDSTDEWESKIYSAINDSDRGVPKRFFQKLLQSVIPKEASEDQIAEIMKEIAKWGLDSPRIALAVGSQEPLGSEMEKSRSPSQNESEAVKETKQSESKQVFKDNLSL